MKIIITSGVDIKDEVLALIRRLNSNGTDEIILIDDLNERGKEILDKEGACYMPLHEFIQSVKLTEEYHSCKDRGVIIVGTGTTPESDFPRYPSDCFDQTTFPVTNYPAEYQLTPQLKPDKQTHKRPYKYHP